jgi:hypothetical protein
MTITLGMLRINNLSKKKKHNHNKILYKETINDRNTT